MPLTIIHFCVSSFSECNATLDIGSEVVPKFEHWNYGELGEGTFSIGQVILMTDSEIKVKWGNKTVLGYRWGPDVEVAVESICHVNSGN